MFQYFLSLIGALLSIAVGVYVLDVSVQWGRLPLTALVITATTAGWFFLLSIFAIRLQQRMDSFNTVTSAAYIFLMFLSSMFYPLADLRHGFDGRPASIR